MLLTDKLFTPQTARIEKLAFIYPKTIERLKIVFSKPTIIYIDYANVRGWMKKLKWMANIKRMKQLFDSFSMIKEVRFYYGTLIGNEDSELQMSIANKYKYDVHTKNVKIIKISIDSSSVPTQSQDLLKQFIRQSLLDKFTIENISYLNNRLKELNDTGTLFIKDKKCNFDVEIGIQMYKDRVNMPEIKNFVLWSGDSDFDEPVIDLIKHKKNVVIFSTSSYISTELSESGAYIYEVRPLRNFICWPKEIETEVRGQLPL